MERTTAILLVRSLLGRLKADAKSERPVFGGLISAKEREALSQLFNELGEPGEETETVVGQEEAQGRPVATPAPVPARSFEVRLDETCLSLTKPTHGEYVLCLDFGTAKSKAFAASLDEEDPALVELALGKRDGGRDGSVYAVSSSVWIDEDGSMFAGSEAVRLGILRAQGGGGGRRRLDSLKQELSQIHAAHDVSSKVLEPELNPSGVRLSYDDAITFYLSYLTDLACSELEAQGLSRYIRRRFTLPWWRPEQRSWASRLLAERLQRAQILADTFRGRWSTGIPAAEFKQALALVAGKETQLGWLLDQQADMDAAAPGRWGGLLEPLAAGSGRIWQDKATRDVTLIVDVGAGTTDFSLFWVVQNQGQRIAVPIEPGGTAIRMAGDSLDSCLVSEILERAHLGADRGLRERVSTDLYLSGVRRLKEQLFLTGTLTHELEDDRIVSLSLDEFLATPGVRAFTEGVSSKLKDFLAQVDASWGRAAAQRGAITMVLTGGGCELPMIRALADQQWQIGGRQVSLRLAQRLPGLIEEEFDATFAQEYPEKLSNVVDRPREF